jgi:hypothetical protein
MVEEEQEEMNEYYVKFKNGGFAYVYADEQREKGEDYVFVRIDPKTKKETIIERYPKRDVKAPIYRNPEFGVTL